MFYSAATYDRNGNIQTLVRNTKDAAGATPMDNLAYVYSGNRLTNVTDSSMNYSGYPDTSGTTISYDNNGNMKNHIDKGIENLNYNHLNLPNYTLFNFGLATRAGILQNNISYLYRADGVKLKKIYNFAPYDPLGTATQLTTEVTDYIDGFQYKGNGKTGKAAVISLLFHPTAEGYYNFENNKYIYSYTDHLGNVRLSYFNGSNGAEVLEENNYYPFGLKHEGYNPTAGNPKYNYKYNGKELQETGNYDYGARQYMSDIGRWFVMDEKTEKYRSWTPYNYAINNPIKYIDPDGKDIINIAGGVRFTGNDAQIAFSAIQQQYKTTGSVDINKIHFVYESMTPNIYKHTLNSFRMGKPEVLHYDGDKSRADQRRKEATAGYPTRPGYDRDEYPYASTFEGGKGANIAYVPSYENRVNQGIRGLLPLYRTMKQGDAFLVVPVPKNTEPEDVKETAPQKVPNAVKVGTGVVAGVVAWEVVKWGAAILLAPETFGASIPAAAAVP